MPSVSPAGDLKECPSCGSQIPAAAVRCTLCKSNLGVCPGCGTWLVAGTSCLDCEKQAVIPGAEKAKLPETIEETYTIDAVPTGLMPYLAVRLVLSAAFVAAAAAALAASGVGPVRQAMEKAGFRIEAGWPVLWGAAGGLVILIAVANTFLRAYRIRRTTMFGEPLQVRRGVAAVAWNVVSDLLILAVTAGLGLPWVHARNRRKFYASCVVPARNARPLEFLGTGEEVLGRALLTLILLPLAVGSAGILAPLITWIWVKWEHSNLLFPDRFGRQRPMAFDGGFGGYYARALLGWLLCILTLGIWRPWALAAEWRWIAANTFVDDEHRAARPAS